MSEKTECGQDALASGLTADPAMIRGDAVRGQAESGRGYTGEARVTLLAFESAMIEGTIEYQTGMRVRLIPEIPEGSAGKVVDKIIISCAQRVARSGSRIGETRN